MAKRHRATQTSKQLTPRQALFLKSLASGATITQAARNAGYSGKNLAQSGHQALKALRSKMPELMDEAGLSERALIQKHLVPLLDATTTKFCTYKGKISDWATVPDNHTQLCALDIALRLHGAYAPRKSADVAHPGLRVVVQDPHPQRPATENSPPLCLPAPQHR